MSELTGIARFTFEDGDVEELKRLSDQAMDIVRNMRSGTLQYDIYLNEDESEAIVIERYNQSEARSACWARSPMVSTTLGSQRRTPRPSWVCIVGAPASAVL